MSIGGYRDCVPWSMWLDVSAYRAGLTGLMMEAERVRAARAKWRWTADDEETALRAWREEGERMDGTLDGLTRRVAALEDVVGRIAGPGVLVKHGGDMATERARVRARMMAKTADWQRVPPPPVGEGVKLESTVDPNDQQPDEETEREKAAYQRGLVAGQWAARAEMAGATMFPVPQDLQDAIDSGVPLTGDQLRCLITAEAHALGLSLEEALARKASGTLPDNYIGADLGLLIDLLPDVEGAP